MIKVLGPALFLCLLTASSHAQIGKRNVPWTQFAGSPTHICQSLAPADPMTRIKWQTPVDMNPHYAGGGYLLCHYGTPLITSRNTVIVTVKVNEYNDFRFEGRRAETGAKIWTQRTEYQVPYSGWTPSCTPAILPNGTLAMPGGGGTVLFRTDPDSPNGHVRRVAFYGLEAYMADPTAYNSKVRICTPLSVDSLGNLFFGFMTEEDAPGGLVGGIAKIAADGTCSWISAAQASTDPTIVKPTYNCAPAISPSGVVYIAVNRGSFTTGYLVGLDSTTLAPLYRAAPHDPRNGNIVNFPDLGTASPMIAPDGDVYMGVFENPYNGSRGWLSHFDAALSTEKIFGAFGWDNCPSLIPAKSVPQYTGTSSYLLFCKYNFYGAGGNPDALAILDPNDSQIEPLTGANVMKEILRVNSPNNAEWCINTAAVDIQGQCVTGNNEDGILYKWNWATNTLIESIRITPGLGEAYTPTLIGPDGTVYAVGNAKMYAVGD